MWNFQAPTPRLNPELVAALAALGNVDEQLIERDRLLDHAAYCPLRLVIGIILAAVDLLQDTFPLGLGFFDIDGTRGRRDRA